MNTVDSAAQDQTFSTKDSPVPVSFEDQSVGNLPQIEKRGNFALITGVVLILIIVTGGVYYFGTKQNKSSAQPTVKQQIQPTEFQPSPRLTTTQENSSGIEYVKGEVVIAFNKGVTETEALSLLNKYKVSLKSPQIFYKYIYITLKTKDGKIDYYANRITELELQNVKRVEAIGKERTNVEPWILINFEPAVSRSEIDMILQISDNLYYKSGMFGPESTYSIIVPEGEEKQIAEQLSKEKIVRTAYVDTVGHININN